MSKANKIRAMRDTDKVRVRLKGVERDKNKDKSKRGLKMTKRWPKVTSAPLHRRPVVKHKTSKKSNKAKENNNLNKGHCHCQPQPQPEEEQGTTSTENVERERETLISHLDPSKNGADQSHSRENTVCPVSAVNQKDDHEKKSNKPASTAVLNHGGHEPRGESFSQVSDEGSGKMPLQGQGQGQVNEAEGPYSRPCSGNFFFSTCATSSGTDMEDQARGYHVKDLVSDVKWCNYCCYTSYHERDMKGHLNRYHPEHFDHGRIDPRGEQDFHGFRADSDSGRIAADIKMSLQQCLDVLAESEASRASACPVSTQTEWPEQVMVTTAEGEFVLIPKWVLKDAPRLYLEVCPEPNMEFLIGKAGQLGLEEAAHPADQVANGETSQANTDDTSTATERGSESVAPIVDTSEQTNWESPTDVPHEATATVLPPPPVYVDAVSHRHPRYSNQNHQII